MPPACIFIAGVEVHRSRICPLLMSLAGLYLSFSLTWEGLYLRLFGFPRDADALWLQAAMKLGVDANGLAWPMVVLGISWIGALIGLWLSLPWGRRAALITSVLSLFCFWIGSIVALVPLIILSLPITRRWVDERNATGTS
jgi:hypothetical protein